MTCEPSWIAILAPWDRTVAKDPRTDRCLKASASPTIANGSSDKDKFSSEGPSPKFFAFILEEYTRLHGVFMLSATYSSVYVPHPVRPSRCSESHCPGFCPPPTRRSRA